MIIRWLILIVVLLGVSQTVFLTENFVWTGHACNSTGGSCESKPEGESNQYFFSLTDCRLAMELEQKPFICSSGLSVDVPFVSESLNSRKIFYSAEQLLKQRDVPYSFAMQIYVLILAAVFAALGGLFVWALRSNLIPLKIKSRQRTG